MAYLYFSDGSRMPKSMRAIISTSMNQIPQLFRKLNGFWLEKKMTRKLSISLKNFAEKVLRHRANSQLFYHQ